MRVWVMVRLRLRVHLVAEGDAVVLDRRVALALVLRCGCGGRLLRRGLWADLVTVRLRVRVTANPSPVPTPGVRVGC